MDSAIWPEVNQRRSGNPYENRGRREAMRVEVDLEFLLTFTGLATEESLAESAMSQRRGPEQFAGTSKCTSRTCTSRTGLRAN